MENITEEAVLQLIRDELDKSENQGLELYKKVFNKKITEEEFKFKVKGYGVWWGIEASYSLKKIKIKLKKELKPNIFEIVAFCTLERISSHAFGIDGPLPEYFATVTLIINKALELEDFNFKW